MKENIKYSFLNRIVNAVVPFIVSMYLARVLEKNDLGIVAYGKNILTYFLVIAMMGIQDYGIREIAKAKDNHIDEAKIFIELVVINSLSTTFSLVLYIIFQTINPDYIISAFVLIIIANYFNFDFLLIGRENFKYIAIRNIIQKLLFTVCVFAFVKSGADVNNYILIYAISQLLLHIPDVLYSVQNIRGPLVGFNISRHFKSIMFLFGTAISLELYSQIDITMLGFWCDPSDIAIYSYSSKLVKMIVVLICSISTVLLPRISYLSNYEEINEQIKWILKLVLLLALPAMIGTFIVSYDLMQFLYGINFYEAGKIVRFLALLIVICSIGNIFGTQVLVSQHKENRLLISTIVGAVINVCLNCVLIRQYRVEGASMASIVSELVVMLLQIYFSREIINIKIEKQFWLGLFISLLILSIIVFMIGMQDVFSMSYRLVTQVVGGFIVYGICIKLFINKIM